MVCCDDGPNQPRLQMTKRPLQYSNVYSLPFGVRLQQVWEGTGQDLQLPWNLNYKLLIFTIAL